MAKPFNIFTTKRSQAFKDGYHAGMGYRASHGLIGLKQLEGIVFSWAVKNGFEKMKDYKAGWKKGMYW
jgi:hypothetical protein